MCVSLDIVFVSFSRNTGENKAAYNTAKKKAKTNAAITCMKSWIAPKARNIEDCKHNLRSQYNTTKSCRKYQWVEDKIFVNFCSRRSSQKLHIGPYCRSLVRGIGYSFQLAITTPRINLIGYGTATAQSYRTMEGPD